LQDFIERRLFKPTSDLGDFEKLDIVLICVPTPLNVDGSPDFGALNLACELIANRLRQDALLINESTSHPGTLRNLIAPTISGLRTDQGSKIKFACSPERVNPGDSKYAHSNTPRVVSGLTDLARSEVKRFYSHFVKEVFVASTPEVAEMSKLLENSFRLVNISFINEISDYCLTRGIPVREVIAAAATKPFGFMPFFPGPGVGGHCIPVDPAYLLKDASEHGKDLPVLSISLSANESRHEGVIKYVENVINGVSGKKILLEGVSYKPNVTDTRETPALGLFKGLKERGALVSWHDPLISEWNGSKSTNVESNNWDATLVLIKHSSTKISELISHSKVIFDFTGQIPVTEAKVLPI
jgi:UDP-N-acetyl-D-glucosamine dehydrogenase